MVHDMMNSLRTFTGRPGPSSRDRDPQGYVVNTQHSGNMPVVQTQYLNSSTQRLTYLGEVLPDQERIDARTSYYMKVMQK